MNIYRVYQTVDNSCDAQHEFICYAKNEENARNMHPNKFKNSEVIFENNKWIHVCKMPDEYGNINIEKFDISYSWVNPKDTKIEYLGYNENVNTEEIITFI